MPELGRRLGVLPPLAPIPEAKAQTGSGWISMATLPHLSSLSRRPEKLIAEAQALFHSNVWVAACERAIVGRFASVEYHLETEDDESVTAEDSPLASSLIEVLNRPSSRRSRRQLWSITARHMGLTGNAFWYLDKRTLLGGTPLECLYINPARMTPAENGSELLGWIMDHPQNPNTPPGTQATPFELDEIIHFVLDEPDWGHYGIGIAETAQSKIELSRLTDKHTSITMASGGRLAGIISPKTGVEISDDGWAAVIRDYRNIVNDPDSAKRLQVIRRPIDFTETSADPTELQLRDVMTGSRDDILAAWAVPLSQLGVVSARGLNSGETPKFEEAALWQGAIESRLNPFAEKIQSELIDRWAELGLKATIVFETPEFDDDAPRYVNAEKAALVPLTNNERRSIVGLDPFEDEQFGSEVYVLSTLTRIDPLGAAPPEPPVSLPPVTQEQIAEPDNAKASPLQTLRSKMEVTWEPRIRKVVLAALTEQRGHIASRIEAKHSHLSRKPTDTAVWWNTDKESKRLNDALEPLVLELAREVANRASDKFPAKAMDAGYLEALTNFIRKRVGERITSISETTRDDISRVVQSGIASGLSPSELGIAIQEATAFGEPRAEMISRTETMFAYNDAALRTYGELGAERVQAIDGDVDEACAARNGREFTVDEAYGITDHPNGTLDWIPIVPAKAQPIPEVEALKARLDELFGLFAQKDRPVHVEVHPSPVNINEGAVQYHAAPITVEAPTVTIPEPRKVKRTVNRDKDGRISEVVEE